MNDVLERFSRMLAAQIDIDPDRVRPESRPIEDFGADSVDLVQLMLEVEGEFGIDIGEAQAQSLHTVGDIVRYIEASLARQKGDA